MAEVISLAEVRKRRAARADPVAEFCQVMDGLLRGLDLMEEGEMQEAYTTILDATQALLRREERIVTWTR